MATIDLNSLANIVQSREHRVYTRAAWADSWLLHNNLFATQSVWCSLPRVPTATLQYFYGGSVLTPGSGTPGTQTPVDLRSRFVLIEWVADDASLIHWLGYIDSIDDHSLGDGSGYQLMTCFGLDRALQVTPITTHAWDDGGEAKISSVVPDFNEGGRPNRNDTKVDGAYLFASDNDDAEYWSTRDIVEYLMTYCLPTPNGSVNETDPIPWSIHNQSLLPDWDRPTVQPEGLSVHSVLFPLVSSRNLVGANVGFSVAADDDKTIDSVVLSIHSLLDTQLDLGGGTTIPANSTQHTVFYNQDPLSNGTLRDNGTQTVDQIVVRGARRVCVCTVDVGSELEKGWEDQAAIDYNAGSTAADLSDQSQSEQRRLHAEARSDPDLRDVYSLLKLSDDFNLPTAEGDDHTTAPHTIQMLARLPLSTGVDYSGDPTAVDDTSGGEQRTPLVWFELPENFEKLVNVETLGTETGSMNEFSPFGAFSVTPQFDDDRTMRLIVGEAPQHAIAGEDFTPNAVDNTNFGDWSYKSIKATVAITDDRFCEVRYPETISGDMDVVRRRFFRAGEAYRQTYIAPDTIVKIRPDNTSEISTGGMLHDDTEKLERVAEILAKYYASPRYDLRLETHRRLSGLAVGHMILAANSQTVRSVINEIRFTAPLAYNRQEIPAATMHIGTSSSTVDPLAVLETFQDPGKR